MRSKWGMSNGEWGSHPAPSPYAPTPHSPLPIPHFPLGVTLVELLITMVIITIISAAVLGTASAAMENAREKRTQGLVTRIHGLLTERLESYSSRRVDISPFIINDIEDKYRRQQTTGVTGVIRGQMMADARLLGLRELIKYEMPDRWSDVFNQPLQRSNPQNTPANNLPTVLGSIPALARVYQRRLASLNPDADIEEIVANEGAECLYLTVMYATGDGEARTMFSDQDIGDTDGDGAPEFLDGWGNPIHYIRWPAGFTPSPLMSADAEGDHDPFDMYRRDSPLIATNTQPVPDVYLAGQFRDLVREMRRRNEVAVATNNKRLLAFRLVPLVYSAGPDGEGDLHVAQNAMITDPYGNDYVGAGESGASISAQLGMPLDSAVDPNSNGDNWKDNIHSHLTEY
jgi:prepilin-type N-terminal cleavage/methylation domain-containing protein